MTHCNELARQMRTQRQNIILTVCLLISLLLLSFSFVEAQHPFNITNYRKDDYKAGNQNWDVDIDKQGHVFIANNKGLLRISGSSVELFESPTKTIIRSVACIDEKIYTGSFEEFGYWEPDQQGQLSYHSLKSLIVNDKLENDEFWKIVGHQNKIYFQSFGKLLVYDENQIFSIPVPGPILFLLKCNNRLFVQQIEGGIYEIVENELILMKGTEIFNNTEVKAMLPFDRDQIIIGTSSEGLFLYNNGKISRWPNQASELIMESKLNNGVIAGDLMIFGTIMRGLVVLDHEGRMVNHLHTGTALQNNTILSLRSDADNNLWVGLDKGFDYIAFDTPFDNYSEDETGFGTVYTACLHNEILYVGTNHGIYFFSEDRQGKFANKKFLAGSQGQVWFINEIDNYLYCGLNDGTYLIQDNQLIPVSEISGGFNLQKIQHSNQSMLLQSTYNQIVVYRETQGIWTQSEVLEGFGAPARFLEVDHTGNILIGHIISGIFMVQPNKRFDSVSLVMRPDEIPGLDKRLNRVYKVDNRILVPTGKTLLQWDPIKKRFDQYKDLSDQLEGFDAAKVVIHSSEDNYWFIKDNELALFEIRFGKAKLLFRLIPEMYGLNLVDEYENIVSLNDSLSLICLESGFSILNLHRLARLNADYFPPQIKEIVLWNKPEKLIRFKPESERKKQFSHSYNNVRFVFAAAGLSGKKTYFQYKLNGIDNSWSDWNSSTEATYNRLPAGTYTFMLRTLNNQGVITDFDQLSFRIRPPWYLSHYALILYLLAFVVLIWLIRLNYLRRHWKNREEIMRVEQELILKEKEKVENEIIRLSNEKLQSEIALKNSQLANNTIALIRKNEILSAIQEELNRQREELGQRIPKKYFTQIHKLIEDSIQSDHDWELFEKLFDQAHENFFQRLKSAYPDLTPSDLRLSAYLRLNLSSKEIAPLLNISVRGVEERRYRLRKRLQLGSEQNLTDFILGF